MSSNAWPVLQITLALLCASAGCGVILSAILLRAKLPVAHPHTPAFDIAQTDRTYQLVSILCSIGALSTLTYSTGAFAAFLSVALSFQIAEHWLIPRLRVVAPDGGVSLRHGVRTRLELIGIAAMALIFLNLSMPPLVTLANIYGLR
jgi:hypothetical protein